MNRFLAGMLVAGVPLAASTIFFAKRMFDNMAFVDKLMAQMSQFAEHPEEVDWETLASELKFLQIAYQRGIPKENPAA